MNRIAAGLLALALAFFATLASAQSPIQGFPPGTFQSRAALDATSGGGGFVGPGDVVASATMWWGFRAYSLAKVGTKIANICNSGDANCADINSLTNGDFDVATAQGAPLNCGSTGGTCTIKTLYDQTAGNACTAATCDLIQSTISNRPTLVFNAVGTKTCMAFNPAASQVLVSSNNATSISQPVTFSGVGNSTNISAAQSLLAFAGGGATQLGYTSANNQVQAFAGTSVTATASGGSFHALQAVLNGGPSSDMNVDGTPNTGFTGADPQVGNFALGAIAGSQFMSGTVCEVGSWPSAFSGGQSSSMSTNQHSYWGF